MKRVSFLLCVQDDDDDDDAETQRKRPRGKKREEEGRTSARVCVDRESRGRPLEELQSVWTFFFFCVQSRTQKKSGSASDKSFVCVKGVKEKIYIRKRRKTTTFCVCVLHVIHHYPLSLSAAVWGRSKSVC